jgi:K+-transporting ATPase A subunit
MAYFQAKNPNLGKFWRDLQRKIGIICGPLVYFVAIWYLYRFFAVPKKIWQPWNEATPHLRESLWKKSIMLLRKY